MQASERSYGVLNRKSQLILGMALVMVYLLHCLALNFVVDDAYITFQYVKNFIHGEGLVYTSGERVEGYTNFLWAMLLRLGVWLAPAGTDFLPIAQTLGVTFGAATILVTLRFSLLVNPKTGTASAIAAGLLAVSAPFIAWSTAGLETTLFALLIASASFCYLASPESSRLTPLLFALAAMTRAEGLLFFGIVSCHLAIAEFRRGESPMSRRVLLWMLTFAVLYVPFYVWRFNYYGYPLPNVFYAKVGSGLDQYLRGLRYLREYLFSYGGILLALPLPFLVDRLKRDQWLQVLLPQVLLYGFYVVYVGGDGLAFQRFWVPILPFACLLTQEAIREAWRRAALLRVPLAANCAAAGIVLLACNGALLSAKRSMGPVLFPDSHRWQDTQSGLTFPGRGSDHPYLSFDNYFIERQRIAARWLDANAEPQSVAASTPAGAIAYYSHLRIIDMLGLNDVHIAHYGHAGRGWKRAGHEKGDGRYVLSRSPDFVLLGNVAVLPRPLDEDEMPGKLIHTSEYEIWADPDFHRQYERVSVDLGGPDIFRYFTFYKKKSVALKNTRGFVVSSEALAQTGVPETGAKLVNPIPRQVTE